MSPHLAWKSVSRNLEFLRLVKPIKKAPEEPKTAPGRMKESLQRKIDQIKKQSLEK